MNGFGMREGSTPDDRNACISSPDGMFAGRGKEFAPMFARTMRTPLNTHIVLLRIKTGNPKKIRTKPDFELIRNILHIFMYRSVETKKSPPKRGIHA
jgi:hypothetical protein